MCQALDTESARPALAGEGGRQTQRDEGSGAGGAWERPKLSLEGPDNREWTSQSSQTETETQLKTPELTHFPSALKTTQLPRPNNWKLLETVLGCLIC